jgi:two-component system chemotaxis sensor kinase CheA
MNLNDALPGFIAECADLLREMEEGLLRCANDAPDAETVNLIFRCAHTVKGSAGLFGLDAIVSFVHVVETVLDSVRLERITVTDELITLLLACKDHIQLLVNQVDQGVSADPSAIAGGEDLLQKLRHWVTDPHATVAAEHTGSPALATNIASASTVIADWLLAIRFSLGVLKAGMDPLSFLRYLRSFCELREVRVLQDGWPSWDELDPEQCYLGFEIELRSDAERGRITGAFDFIKDDCQIQLTQLNARVAVPDPAEGAKRTAAAASGTRENPKAAASSVASRSVRVDSEKLDTLITRIGELIIAAAGINSLAHTRGDGALEEQASTLTSLVEQVREGALQLRMVRIGGTFERFQRVVHDVSRELGKEINLELQGKDTELDKTVVEQIGDPLTHLVRNAIDHGIESAEVRARCGKPAAGTIRLNAFHDSGNIVIQVSDDGGGLRKDRILAKARERGLIQEDRTLADTEIFQLIFEPGFSTAEQVTNLSGRGVGMDVVKRNITALRGSVAIESTEGQGTTVTVRLPLTLAIINGFQIAVGSSNFVLPLDAVEECLELPAQSSHDFTELRGKALPFVRLRELVGNAEPTSRRPSIVVVRNGAERAGIVVDTLLGELQTVIKPLARMFNKVDYVSGSTILGNGEVALVLDVPALLGQAVSRGWSRKAL